MSSEMSIAQDKIERLKHLVTSAATDGTITPEDEKEYTEIRGNLLAIQELQAQIPGFVRTCSNLREVRREIQPRGGYAIRREFVKSELSVLLTGVIQRDPFQEVVAATDISKLVTLPADIQQKGKEGADCFIYLFCIENSIREFIVQVGTKEPISIPKQVQRKIDDRKSSENNRKYLPVRGTSDVYYCDFIELADIVRANWTIFSKYFPGRDEHWFTSMLKHLYEVRLLIGHNSAVGAQELQFLDVFYRIIMTSLKIE